MDGGAYVTLTPVVLSRGTIHAGGPYECPNVRIRGRAMATNTPPNGAFRGFGAPQTEFAAETQVNRIAERLGLSPLALRRSWVYREGGVTPTGQVLRESVAGLEVLEAAAQASEYEGVAAHTRKAREVPRGRRAHRARHRSGARVARRRLHRIGRGPPGQRGIARAHRGGRHPDPDRLDRDGPGNQDHLPAARGRGPGGGFGPGRHRAPGHLHRPRLRPHRGLAHGHGGGRPPDQGRRASSGPGRDRHRRFLRRDVSVLRRRARRHPGGRAVHPVSGRHLRRRDLPGRRVSMLRLGERGGRGGDRPRHRRGERDRCRQRR